MFCASLIDQLTPGTLEPAIDYLVAAKVGLEIFVDRYNNDRTGKRGYDPRSLLKFVLYSYYLGMASLRKMEKVYWASLTFTDLAR